MKKRLLSMAMALVMTLSLLPGAMFAAPAGSGSVAVDSKTFPDAKFLSFVQTLPGAEDGKFTQAELDKITEIDCGDAGISNMKGIEVFGKLKKLSCFGADILDLSHNPELTSLYIGNTENGGMTSLDLSHNPKLVDLNIFSTGIRSLDLSHNPNLASLSIWSTYITSLDLSHNPKLASLHLKRTDSTSLDLSHNSELKFLDLENVDITSLDLSHNPNLVDLHLIWEFVQGPVLEALDLSHNPNLENLEMINVDIAALDVSHNPKLTRLKVALTGITALDVTHNPNLTELFIQGNEEGKEISELDISRNPKLEAVWNWGKTPLILPREGVKVSVLKNLPEDAQFTGCSVTADGMLAFDEGVDEASYEWVFRDDTVTQILKRHPKGYFPDVKPGAWFYNGVTYSAGKGLMSGLPDGTFGPSVTMTRAQLVQMLYAMEGKPDVDITGKFSDMKPTDWFAKAVSWAVEAGVTGGVGDGTTFAANNKITRQEMAVMLYAYMGRPAVEGKLDFVDNADIAGWAGQAVVWVVDNGLMGSASTAQRQFAPKNTATRAEAAVIMMNLDKMLTE